MAAGWRDRPDDPSPVRPARACPAHVRTTRHADGWLTSIQPLCRQHEPAWHTSRPGTPQVGCPDPSKQRRRWGEKPWLGVLEVGSKRIVELSQMPADAFHGSRQYRRKTSLLSSAHPALNSSVYVVTHGDVLDVDEVAPGVDGGPRGRRGCP